MKKDTEDEKYTEVINVKVAPTMKSKMTKIAPKYGHNLSSLARLWLSERLKEEKVK